MCLQNWKQITADPWILQCVTGCQLELLSVPQQEVCPLPLAFTTDRLAVTEEVDKLISKGAISKVTPERGQFVSRIFTVPKKDGSRRPVVNLKPLNQYILKQRFKMEGVGAVRSIVQEGDWMVSVDLKDAYLSVVMAKQHRKFLRFEWENKLFEFNCLPFGLSSAPRIFTKLLKPVMALLRRQGTRIVIFLDDMLIMDQSKEQLIAQTKEVIMILQLLGFVVNFKKSALEPKQVMVYLGFLIDSQNMRISLPQEKVQQINQDCEWALRQETLSVRDLSRLIGRMTATMQAVLPAPLCYRSLQRLKNKTFSQTQSYMTRVTLDHCAKEELLWWKTQLQHWNGKAMIRPTPDIVVETDASLLGWGAVSEGVRTNGLWSESERSLHINHLELMAGDFAVKTFARHRTDVHLQLKMDNKTAVFYVNKMGGTKSNALSHSACLLWQWCLQKGITISAEYLPGENNVIADHESRLLLSSAEWMLNKGVFRWLMEMMGPCRLDLFATRLNHQLDHYVSWRPDPFAQATDAFQILWRDQDAYAFPPFALIGKCLQKVRNERASLLLIAPTWSAQPWYPVLLDLLVGHPLLLPRRADLLRDPFNRLHPLKDLQLAAWRISGDSTQTKEYQQSLPSSSLLDGAKVQTKHTSQHGRDGIAGVINGRLIPFLVTSDSS